VTATRFRHDGSRLDPMLLQAIALAGEHGWCLFPVKRESKRPHISKWPVRATDDGDVIARWWTRWRGANIGIATGSKSHVVVLDVDGAEGRASLARLVEEHAPLPATYRVSTGREDGGEHFYFRIPDGVNVPTRVGRWQGIDIKGDRGQAVGAGSVHRSGSRYAAADPKAPVAPAPDWLLAATERPQGGPAPTTRSVGVPVADYVARAIAGELEALTGSGRGERNDQLNRSACALGHYVGSGQADEEEVFDALLTAALKIGLSEAEAGATIRSGLKAGKVEPMRLVVLGGKEPADENVDDVLALVRAEFLAHREDGLDHLADLVDDDALAALPPVEWVVDRWVPRGTYSVLYGPPGVGKTLALIGMSRAVRRGSRWQDWKTQQGGVLFYHGEGLQQLRDRVRAWDERYPLRGDQRMASGKYRQAIFDLTREEGVAAVIRTVRALEAETDERFSMIVIDPLVEFMTGEENGEGMQRASRGLRALARLLDCAVVVGHHTNADGSRERGAMFLRMRAGTVMRLDRPENVEELGLVQEKNRFDEKQAIGLRMAHSGPGVVLEWTGLSLAEDYAADQKAAGSRRKAVAKERRQAEAASVARQRAIDVVRAHPGISKTQAFAAAGGNRSEFHAAIDGLVREGRIRREPGPRQAQLHWLVEGGQP